LPLQPGVRLGSYEILSALGAGGMGEVYRARDTNLKREVAIKVLPEGFSQDPDRLARFQREAELLATLNHPNIAAVYGLEKSEGVTAIVLELVEGDTLAEHLVRLKPDTTGAGTAGSVVSGFSRTGMPLDEALAIGRQVADALEAAHEKGVVHRDLKPANIKITPDGKVKVLDFGLAKMLEGPGGSGVSGGPGGPGGLSMSPTLSVHATFAGTILGTAAYMSPEQARGKPVDRRTDIWAFGCVLYEMLTGRQAFDTGETVSDAIAAILKTDVDWTALPADVPDQIRLLLKRCLEKDRAARIGEIGTARFLMTETIAVQPPRATDSVAPLPPSRGRSVLVGSAGVIAGAALAAGVAWWVVRSTPPAKVQPMRFVIATPATLPLAPTNSDRQLVITPDGSHVVYVAGRETSGFGTAGAQLMIRSIDQIEAVPLRGITSARFPFFSPDGKWIAYFDGQTDLKKVSVTGGPPISLCRIGASPRGGSWGADDTIVFTTVDTATGLLSVPAGGGEPKVLTKPDAAHGETGHWFPSFLPSGRAVLYTIRPAGGIMDNAQVAVLDLKTGKAKTLIRGGAQAEYIELSSGSGRTGLLIYAVAGSLRAVRFDPITFDVLSDPVPVLEQLASVGSGAAQYTVSRTGALVFVPGGLTTGSTFGGGALRTLVWIDRRGHEESIPAPARSYVSPRLSPDGTTIALDSRDQELDIWTFDLARKTLTRLTMDPAVDGYPVWTPDGRRIIFESNRGGGVFNLYSQAADGTGVPEALTKSQNSVWPHSISPDGTRMVLHETGSKTGDDLDVLVMDGKSKPEPLIQTAFSEQHGEISPDGRWLAYDSNDSGQQQVHVRPFPNVNSGHWQVSPSGGSKPVWAHNGKELFYLSGRAMMAVPVQTTTSFSAGNPVKLFEGPYFSGGSARVYDVSRDGQKFLMIKEPPTTTDLTATQASMVVVLNWTEELKARLSAR